MAIASDAASWPTEGLDEAELAADPERQFNQWMADAVTFGLPEPTAVVLATVSAAGQPRARTVLLKDHDASSFTFYTNRTSRKGADLDEVPRACLLFPWHAMHRQVIVEGPVTALPAAASEAYFHSRPRGPAASPPCLSPGASLRIGMPAWSGAGAAARRFRIRSSGAASGWCRRPWSSGMAGRIGCMTGCATAGRTTVGWSSGWRPDRIRARRRPPPALLAGASAAP